MINPKLILCADSLVIDAQSNNVSVFNIFEEISPQVFPAIIPRFSILSVLERDQDDPNEMDIRLKITLGTILILEQDMHVNFQGKPRTRNLVAFGGMPLPQPGLLLVSFTRGETLLHSYQVQIKEAPQPQQISLGT